LVGRWCGVDSPGSGYGPLAGCCECGDESSGSDATELVILTADLCKKLRLLMHNGLGVSAWNVLYVHFYFPKLMNRFWLYLVQEIGTEIIEWIKFWSMLV
jgi:hypothetical protein